MRKTHVFQGKKEQPAMTQLKQLDAETRAELFKLATTENQDVTRRIIERDHGIKVSSNSLLSRWCSWQLRQAPWDRLGDMVEQDEAAMQSKFPDVPREKLRDAAIKRSYAIADLMGDTELTLEVVKTDLKDSTDRRDWKVYQRETCELFLKWAEDQKAKEIATSSAPTADKIEKLGQLIFGNDWQ